MRYLLLPTVLVLGCLLNLSCAKRSDSQTRAAPVALPSSWYQPTGGAQQKPGNTQLESPSAEMDRSVRAQFAAHTAAVSDLLDRPASADQGDRHPADWVPWHLDGMIADFTVDVAGVFGLLMSEGTAVVKGTWQHALPTSAPSQLATPKTNAMKNGVKFNSSMKASNVKFMLEPAVRLALATGTVQNEAALRKNLSAQGVTFLTLAKVLDGLPAKHGWHVDGLQLQLTFDAQGKVTPVVSAGGQINIYFDWQKNSGPAAYDAIQDSELFQNVAAFAQNMNALIPEALLESKDIQIAGFALDQFQVGVAVLAGLKLGIAQTQSTIQGKIIFKSNESKSAFATSELSNVTTSSLDVGQANGFIPFVASPSNDISGLFSEAVAGSPSGGQTLVQIPVNVFRQGLERAIRMGSYFVHRAQEADTRKWKVTEIETEFDASIGGEFSLATISGQGQFVLNFDRITK